MSVVTLRRATPADTEALMALWLASTTEAHPFIDADYWRESAPLVRSSYLPAAVTWVAEQEGRIVGFISVLELQFVGALFVERGSLGAGVGHRLMAQAQSCYPRLWLEVYRRNVRAMAFYLRHGFEVQETQFNAETGHHTVTMMWQSDSTC